MSKTLRSNRLALWVGALCSLAVAVPGTAFAAAATADRSAPTVQSAAFTTSDQAAPAARLGPRQVGRSPGKVRVGKYFTPVFKPYKQNPTNPLANRTMGVYQGPQDQVWAPFQSLRNKKKRNLLGKIALRPRTKWFGSWVPPRQIASSVRTHIENAQEGDPSVLVQLTAFALQPWYTEACHRAPSKQQQQTYKRWIRNFARGVGNTPTAIILQPDLPFVLCSPRPRIPYKLVTYAAKVLSQRPNAAVYIDVGAADWPKNQPVKAAKILRRAGVRHARGFALNATHYAPTPWDVRHGTKVVRALNRMGPRPLKNKKFVVNTSSAGKGFDFGNARGPHEDHADVCRTKQSNHCVTLGIPPTTAVAHKKWRLPRDVRLKARKHTDAYLWFGRPWLYMQNDPFQMQRALQLARTSPW